MNCWYVYIIHCSSGKLYIGSTDNLERRYEEQWSRAKKEALIAGDLNKLRNLSKRRK
jgi:predicted GIY-YIG superfamily endonuclease